MAIYFNEGLEKHIDWERSVKRPWWDITALWRGRYVTIHIDLEGEYIFSERESKETVLK